ncbi:MAG: hypothetical protein AAB524_02200 [Patescibacteria group bacterium]
MQFIVDLQKEENSTTVRLYKVSFKDIGAGQITTQRQNFSPRDLTAITLCVAQLKDAEINIIAPKIVEVKMASVETARLLSLMGALENAREQITITTEEVAAKATTTEPSA